jgi:hypothetical protein
LDLLFGSAVIQSAELNIETENFLDVGECDYNLYCGNKKGLKEYVNCLEIVCMKIYQISQTKQALRMTHMRLK